MGKKLGTDQAFPGYEEGGNMAHGISKRFYAACAAMQGLLAHGYTDSSPESREYIILKAYTFADELLKQENQ